MLLCHDYAIIRPRELVFLFLTVFCVTFSIFVAPVNAIATKIIYGTLWVYFDFNIFLSVGEFLSKPDDGDQDYNLVMPYGDIHLDQHWLR